MISADFLFEQQSNTRLARVTLEPDTNLVQCTIFKLSGENGDKRLHQNLYIKREAFEDLFSSVPMERHLIKILGQGRMDLDLRSALSITACDEMKEDSKQCEVIEDMRGEYIEQKYKLTMAVHQVYNTFCFSLWSEFLAPQLCDLQAGRSLEVDILPLQDLQ